MGLPAKNMIRLALLGCDNAAGYEAAISRLRSVRFVACVDDEIERAHRAATALGASTVLGRFDELLERHSDTFDAVLVDSFGPRRGTWTEQAARAGMHLLVRSPLASSRPEADRLIAAASSAGVCLMSGQARRFLPSSEAVKAAITSGKLGVPGLLRIHLWEPFDRGRRQADRRGAEDAVMELEPLVGGIDLANWLFQTVPQKVFALGRSSSGPRPAFEYVQVHLGFPEGGMAMIDCTVSLPAGEGYFSLSMIGSAGAAYADDQHNVNLQFGGGPPKAVKVGQGQAHLTALIEEFACAVREQRAPAITGADGREAVQVAQAVVESIHSGRAARRKGDDYELV